MTKQKRTLVENAKIYARLMEEIKRRVEVIQNVLTGKTVLAPMAAFELCYLQFRKICEVFALACLAVHGDIPGIEKKIIQKEYNADDIMFQLTQLHPDFFPVPSTPNVDTQTESVVSVTPITSGYLTREDLSALYGECGNYLHRGSIRQLLSEWEPSIDFDKISLWLKKIITLLSHHQIRTIDPDRQLWVMMQDETDGKVHWFVMMGVAGPPDLR